MRTFRYICWLGALLTVPLGGSEAGTLRVPSEFSTIQSAIDAAHPGDTVLVAPGTYTNCDGGPCLPDLALLKEGVDLVSEGGPDVTVLRVDTGAGSYSVVRGIGIGSGGVLLKGFTVTSTALQYRGARFGGSTNIRVEDCRFVDMDSGLDDGSGIRATQTDLHVKDSEFVRCTGTSGAGLNLDVGNFVVERCLFEECTGGGASLDGFSNYSAQVVGCTFRNNTENSALTVLSVQAEIIGNRFEGNSSVINGTAISLNIEGATALLAENVFLGNDSSAHRSTVTWSSSGEAVGNTFVGNVTKPGWPVFLDLSPTGVDRSMHNSIFAFNDGVGYEILFGAPDPVGCNLFWENSRGDYEGYVPAPTDLFVDPLLCDPTTGDVSLQEGSPCLPENSNGCGLIGALGQGCGTVSVESRSWGKVKAGYREGEDR